jgi:5'-nucleotidase/UDP-sugar diphosphatase
VATVVKQYKDSMAAQLDVIVGATSDPLDTRNDIVRTQESAVGDLIADLLRTAMRAAVALIDGGGIRGNAVLPAARFAGGIS